MNPTLDSPNEDNVNNETNVPERIYNLDLNHNEDIGSSDEERDTVSVQYPLRNLKIKISMKLKVLRMMIMKMSTLILKKMMTIAVMKQTTKKLNKSCVIVCLKTLIEQAILIAFDLSVISKKKKVV